MKKIVSILLALVMVFALAACGDSGSKDNNSGNAGSNGASGDNGQSASTVLDVALTNSFSGASAMGKENPYRTATFNQVYETLLCVVNGEYKGVMAESWEKLDDTTWKVKLYDGIKDSEGNAFTADDVVWILDMQKNNSHSLGDYYELGAGKKVDDLTVEISMNTDSEGCFYLVATRMFMCTQKAYEASSDGMATMPVGTGPYKCASYVEGSSCQLVKRADYWKTGDLPEVSVANFDTINISYLPEATQMSVAIDSGNVQFAGQVNMSISQDVDAADVQAIYTTNGTYNGMIFNMGNGRIVSDNLALRKAICYALDCAGLAQGAYSGHAVMMNTFGMNTATDFDESWTTDISYDLAKAKELLKEAGYENGVDITLVSNNVGEDSLISELAQGYLSQAGINVNINFVEPATQSTILAEGNWDIAWVGGMAVSDMSVFYTNIYKNAQKGQSAYFLSDPELIDLYTAYFAPGGKTAENLQALYEYTYENVTWFPMFHKQVLFALDNQYSSFVMHELYMNTAFLGTIA